jgi:hypothetical protein
MHRARSNGGQLKLQMELAGLQTQAVGLALCAHCMRSVARRAHGIAKRTATQSLGPKRCRAKKKAAAGVDDSIILARVRAGFGIFQDSNSMSTIAQTADWCTGYSAQ